MAPPTSGLSVDRESFVAFSEGLQALDRLAPAVSPARLMSEGLTALRQVVPFDAAWWGECSGGMDGLAPRSWLSGRINLSAEFSREWNAISHRDRFARSSMQQLDTVVIEVGYADPEPAVEAFARRHDLYHVMAITRLLPGSGLLHYICLYRQQCSPPYNAVQSLLFQQFTAHLMRRWGARVATLIASEGTATGADDHALLDAGGEFVYVGARMALLLKEHAPSWEGSRLPAPLAGAFAQGAGALKLGRRRLVSQACGELTLLSIQPQHRGPVLPPREMGVAVLYAEGRSYKEIALQTGLAPATVRTYLREAYLRLGVSDKVALGRALAGRRPARPR
ncbi:LuxR C-terminal-related transcriptional regulator [Ideonella sp. DXS29W]|uniref:LuxR C-terminal-related transcriptional regulator n=1 Tax=Ideonella lacteola TaxID=2984193 RepID=A0ABU9BYV5_9BURK